MKERTNKDQQENSSFHKSDQSVKSFIPPKSRISPIPVQNKGLKSFTPPSQLKVNEEEEKIQMKEGKESFADLEAEVQKSSNVNLPPFQFKSQAGTGKQMPEQIQQKMEKSFGQDFSNVNIQESGKANDLNALAYTQGNDIHFAPGQYDPHSQKGQELLGHELTHVVQQRQGKVEPTVQYKGTQINNDAKLETEADEMGKKAAEGKTIGNVSESSGGLQLKSDYYFDYHILKNETLLDIAVYFNVPVESIKQANPFLKEDKYTEGRVIKIPAPEKFQHKENTNKAPDKDADKPDYLHLIDQKNQALKVTADDFENFLNLYNKFSMPQSDGSPAQPDTKDLKDLKYLLGAIQDQYPNIKKYIDKAQAEFNNGQDKILSFIKALWHSGIIGKLEVAIPAAIAATGVAIPTIQSVKLSIAGKSSSVNDKELELVEKLLENIKYEKKSEDYSGNVTPDAFQFDEEVSYESKKYEQTGAKGQLEIKANKAIEDESDRKVLNEAKFADKTVWADVDNTHFYDTLTLRNFIHKTKTVKDTERVVKVSDITTVRDLIQSVPSEEDIKKMKLFHLKDKQVYTYAQILAMFGTGAVDGKEEIANAGNVKAIKDVEILGGAKIYGDEFMSADIEGNGGVGFTPGYNGLNYSFGGSLTLNFPGKKSNSFLKFDYSQDQHYTKLGNNLNQWSERFARELLFEIGRTYNLDLGEFHTVLGANASYKHSYENTTNLSTRDKDVKNENTISLNPNISITFDKDHTNMKILVSPQFMWQDGKFKSAIDIGLSGLKISKNSYFKIDLKLKDRKLDKASFNVFYVF